METYRSLLSTLHLLTRFMNTKTFQRLALLSLTMVLLGQGCLAFGGTSSRAADGGIWRTDDVGATWTQMSALPGPSGVGSIAGVNVTTMEIDPSDQTTYYLGTEANGMFFSLDNGSTWQKPKGTEARSGQIIDIEVHPEDVCTIYILRSDRLLKTTDCNRTFETMFVEPREDESITKMILDWYNPNVIWLGTSAGDVIRSIDAGGSWATVATHRGAITDILLSHKDSRIVLVGTDNEGLFRSIDEGQTWVEYERDLRKDFKGSNYVYAFAQDRKGGLVIMDTKAGPLVSYDSGETWDNIMTFPAQPGARVWSIAVEPDNPAVFYYGLEGAIYSTVNGGETWTTNEVPSNRAPKVIQVHPVAPERVFVGFAAVED